MTHGDRQTVFLNEHGARALQHLSPDWIQDKTLDCRMASQQGAFVEVKARARALPDEEAAEVHLLIPIPFIDLIILDEPERRTGFAGSAP